MLSVVYVISITPTIKLEILTPKLTKVHFLKNQRHTKFTTHTLIVEETINVRIQQIFLY